MKKDTKHFFWPSYVDVMTALFVIMLLLFILIFSNLQGRNKQLVIELQDKKKLERINESIRKLPSEYFKYDSTYKRFSLTRQPRFDVGSDKINDEEDRKFLISVGSSMLSLIDKLKKDDTLGVNYLVILEGMASDDGASKEENFLWSHKRAIAVYDLWTSNGLNFSTDYIEVILAGSGTGGVGRDAFQYVNGIKNDILNQKILIQIIPKLGKVE